MKKDQKKKRILIVSASAGAGHTMSAQAVKEVFDELYENEIETVHIDVLQYSTKLLRKVFTDFYIYLAKKRPLLYGFFYKFTDKESFKSGFNDWVHTKKFRKYLKKNNFDFIISTHFLPSNVISRMKEKKKGNKLPPLLTILTDFGAHKIWISRSEYYVVPDDLNREYFIQRGVSGNNVFDFGIPLRQEFSKPKQREQIRKNLGLSGDKKTILLLSGGFGVGPVIEIIKNLDKVKTPHETIVICGKNEKLLNDCKELESNLNYRIFPVGFSTNIDEYMRASDVIITKPGGLTIAESLASGLPIIIVNPIIGQEDKNADRMLEEGCAIKASYLSIMYYYVDRLFNDTEKYNEIKKNIKRFAKPKASYDLVKFVYSELNKIK